MFRKTVSAIMMSLLVLGTLALVFNIQPVWASGTTYIRADGSIDPPTAPISTTDGVTYTFTGNILSHPTYSGIVVERSNIVINGNGYTLQGSDLKLGNGIDLTSINDVTIENTKVTGFWAGIWLNSSSRNTVSRNSLTGNNNGIYAMHSSNNNKISSNNLSSNSLGIDFWGCSDNEVWGNSIIENDYAGIWLDNCGWPLPGGNTFSGNNISSNYYGIVLDESPNNTLSGNSVCRNSKYGIYLYSNSSELVISGNDITGNSLCAIYLNSSSYNSIFGNNVTKNGVGINLASASSNIMYHNNFIGNSAQVFIDSASLGNAWNDTYPSGGNYWSDYNGTDSYNGPYQNETGSDAIGDSPYSIGANNKDNYPLMHPYPYGQSSTFVVCSPSAVSVGSSANLTAIVSGSNPTGTVTWSTSSKTGSFSQSVCTLSNGTCSTFYSDNSTGSETITASYGGDSANTPSSGSTVLTVFVNVTVGVNVTVYPTSDLGLTFANVTAAGYAAANKTSTVEAPLLVNIVGQYFDIRVTASYIGNVTVSLAFDGSNMTEEQKSNLTMMQYTPIPGDIRPDFGKVDMKDIGYVAKHFGTDPTSPLWDPSCDITGSQYLVPDGKVDMRDLGVVAKNFGKTSQWVNITTHVDTVNNVIYGQTTHFSLIGIH